ncbi:MAG: uncharacterized protein PWR01_3969 [Clostridiales bacterium]|jgi:TPR repeat protein|nr:uncharacterized protein [Clostridiales bacterium]MDN5282896.1 uncharacterized protein [Candidatus Ozemobacter sp.]
MSAKRKPGKIFIIFIALAVIGLFFTGCCKKTSTMDEAGKAYQSGDFKKAAEMFVPEAEKGNAEAQANIAFMYYCGMHFPKDHKKAAEWYTRSAKQNYLNAQFSLGTLYENGEGVKRDFEKAYFWYSLAEKQGDKDAKRLRREVERQLSAKQIKELKQKIAAWKPEK